MREYVDVAEPSMVQFMAEKMVENEPTETLFGAMFKIMMAIVWTEHQKHVLIHDMRNDHSRISERSMAVGLAPPKPTQIGAWTTMLCDGAVDPKQFADTEFVQWVRESLNRRTVLDNG